MFLKVTFLTTLALLEIAVCFPLQEDKIDPIDMSYVSYKFITNGQEIEKNPVIFIHGVGASGKTWGKTLNLAAAVTNRKIYAIDLRNHGNSPWSDRFDIDCLTADLKHFFDKESIKNAIIVGHSLGGKIGIHFSLKFPDLVESLVVEDMKVTEVTAEGEKIYKLFTVLQQLIDTVEKGKSKEEAIEHIAKGLNKLVEEMGIPEQFNEKSSTLEEIHLVDGKWQFKMNINVLIKALKDTATTLPPVAEGLYNGPSLFIFGSKSFLKVGEDKDNILNFFPNAKFVEVEGAGHNIHKDNSSVFDEELIKFLNR